MNNWILYLIGIIFFIIAGYLLLGKISWFSRAEIYRTIKPKNAKTENTPEDLFDFYVEHSHTEIKYELWEGSDGNKKVKAAFFDSDIADVPLISNFIAEEKYYKEKSLGNITQCIKFLGFIESMSNSNALVRTARHVAYNVLKPLMLYLLMIFIILYGFIFIIIDQDIGMFVEFLPFFLLVGVFIYSFHLIKEFSVYISQNLRSLRFAKAFGLSDDEYKAISGYLWKNYFLYVIFQAVKIFIIITFAFLILVMLQ
ncbi:hypothetical protein [Salinicoccus albus]|uniref:hypothetical protein n=1 Tax=Salinicoccus albus TaxID=418756 RepID=UPI000364FA11|nr:hypothetical protein [Salinicoccus albus]